MSRRAWRVVQLVGGVLIVAFLARDVARNWEQVRSAHLEWHFQPLSIVGAALITWVMYALLISSWRGFLRDWGSQLGWLEAARIWAVSSLGKYIPGKVWAIAGMALMAQRAGAAPWAATASAILMQGLAVGTGVLVVAIAGISTLRAAYPQIGIALGFLALASALGIVVLVSPPVTRLALRRIAPGTTFTTPRLPTTVMGVLANTTAWTGYGIAFWLLAHGVLPESVPPLRLAVGAFAASYLAGLLFLLAPGGLLVRETVMVLMLQGAIGVVPAGALAVASRLLLTLTEVGAAVPFLTLVRDKDNRVPS